MENSSLMLLMLQANNNMFDIWDKMDVSKAFYAIVFTAGKQKQQKAMSKWILNI